MSSNKKRIGALGAFFETGETEESQPKKSDTKKVKESKPKSTLQSIYLYDKHIDYLDETAILMRRDGGKRIGKSEFIRQLLDFLIEQNIDFQSIKDTDEIQKRFHDVIKS